MDIKKGDQLILKLLRGTCFLTPSKILTLSDASFPPTFSYFPNPCYVSFRILEYSINNTILKAEILEYCIGDIPFPELQIDLKSELAKIQEIQFNRLNTNELFKFRSGLNPQILPYKSLSPKRHNLPTHWSDITEVPFKNITFENGRVSFTFVFPITLKEITLYIHNPFIKKEFEAIKEYFAKVLKIKTVSVKVSVITNGVRIVQEEATSDTISQINESLLDQIRINVIKKVIRYQPDEDKQILHSLDEVLNEAKVDPILFDSEEQFMESVIGVTESKHFRHLQYLANEHKSDLLKLQFVFSPISFCFLLEGKNGYFFIWETVDTEEATYIWEFPKRSKDILEYKKQLEHLLITIVSKGKQAYLANKPLNFKRIIHNYTEKDAGFNEWKRSVQKIILDD